MEYFPQIQKRIPRRSWLRVQHQLRIRSIWKSKAMKPRARFGATIVIAVFAFFDAVLLLVIFGDVHAQRIIRTLEICVGNLTLPNNLVALTVNVQLDHGVSSASEKLSPVWLSVFLCCLILLWTVRSVFLWCQPCSSWRSALVLLGYYPLIIRPLAIGFDLSAIFFVTIIELVFIWILSPWKLPSLTPLWELWKRYLR